MLGLFTSFIGIFMYTFMEPQLFTSFAAIAVSTFLELKLFTSFAAIVFLYFSQALALSWLAFTSLAGMFFILLGA